MEVIWYRGVGYPARTIVIDGISFLVSVVTLWNELFDDIRAGSFEAMEVDDSILYYCNEQELNNLTDEEIYNLTC